MSVTEFAPAVCDQHEYNQVGGNANIIMFRDDAWPYEGSPNTLALTTVTYNLDTGEIYDADMELNSADNHFTTGDTGVEFDLLVDRHARDRALPRPRPLARRPRRPCSRSTTPRTTTLRDLSPDDIAGICAVYPPGPAPVELRPHPAPRLLHLCAGDQPDCTGGSGTGTGGTVGGCCSVAPGLDGGHPRAPGDKPGGGYGAIAAGLGVALLSVRRARARWRRRAGAASRRRAS